MQQIFTIGYEGASASDLIGTLIEMGVTHLMDVREIAQSRRPGFSKTALASALSEAGIGYSHWRQLGDPKAGREAARAGRMDEFISIFEAHLEKSDTVSALSNAARLVRDEVTVLLCYERNPKFCHRSLVAERLSDLCSLPVRHLGVVENAGKHQHTATEAA